jgi:2-succinyl-5-enolpyruvyl-6-hydroxy-3-cyclohexene-1-carboxylate synthase
MSRYQPIYDIAELCSRKELFNAVLCPGSRCAPLAIAFGRHEKIRARTFSDERSAGFIALGMAQQSGRPTILLCTSGTAVYNFSPAVAEAFFNQVPLLVFTADRPSEWIAQHDGQTIYQSEIFGKHVKKSFQLPQDYDHPDSQWAINRIVNEAINLSLQEPLGPVHINAPFREPLYPAQDELITYSEVKNIEQQKTCFDLSERHKDSLKEEWKTYHNILIVAGQHDYDNTTIAALQTFLNKHNVPVVGDIICNLHPLDNLIQHADLFLGQASADIKKSLRPDLLVTFGKSVLSKNLKSFLRNNPPKSHWHIQPSGSVADTFQTLTQVLNTTPLSFFTLLSAHSNADTFENQRQNNYSKLWEIEERRTLRTLDDFFPQPDFAELELVKEVIHALPENSNLHLANSMSVRYANFIGLVTGQKGVTVFANRGTSGIDGCTSTTVGHCLLNDKPNILITGDLAFFYDRNAFWNNYAVPNLRIVVLNNHGGVIFKMIDGPGSLPEADEYFITKQKLNAAKLCEEFGFDYLKLDIRRKVKNLLKDFMDFDGRTKILELETDTTVNKKVFDNFKQKIKNSYEL